MIDFEDLLELAVRLYEEDEWALAALRERYRAFTVDEYQDVNLLQQTLLELWLGDRRRALRGRRRLPVDLRLHRRLAASGCSGSPRATRSATVVRLEEQLPLDAGGAGAREPARAAARAARRRRCGRRGRPGRSRCCAGSARPRTRARSCSSACGRSRPRASPYEEMAVLIRTNARSADFEEVFARCGHPVPGRVAARPRRRPAAAEGAARRAASARWPTRCGGSREEPGSLEPVPDGLGERELDAAGRSRSPGASWPRSSTTARGRSSSGFELSCARGSTTARRRGVHLLTLPPREGARVRRGVPPARRGEGAPVQAGNARAGRDRRGAAAALRRHDAGEAPPRAHLGAARRAASWPSSASTAPAPAARRPRARGRRTTRPTRALKRWRLQRSRSRTRSPPTSSSTTATLAEIADAPPEHDRRARVGPGRRPGEARALRRRGARRRSVRRG